MIFPIISIILRSYNRKQYVGRAIESVLSQDFQDFELLIVDDGSTQETLDVLKVYAKKDSRVRLLKQEHAGLTVALNRGVGEARGKYIAILDDDDFWCNPRKTKMQIAFLEEHPEYMVVGGGVKRIDGEGREIGEYMLPKEDEEIRRVILQYNPIANISAVFRKQDWEKIGGYNESLNFSEDWDLWMRLGKIGKLHNIQEYLAVYQRDVYSKPQRELRRIALNNLMLRKEYKKAFPDFWKGYFVGLVSYCYSSIPLLYRLHSILHRIRTLFLGSPGYIHPKQKHRK